MYCLDHSKIFKFKYFWKLIFSWHLADILWGSSNCLKSTLSVNQRKNLASRIFLHILGYFKDFKDMGVMCLHGYQYLYIYNILCVSVCLLVCLHPINVRTAQSIGSKFCVGYEYDMTPREGLRMIKMKKISFQRRVIFIEFQKFTKFIW